MVPPETWEMKEECASVFQPVQKISRLQTRRHTPSPCQAAASTETARAHGRSGGEPLKIIREPPHRLWITFPVSAQRPLRKSQRSTSEWAERLPRQWSSRLKPPQALWRPLRDEQWWNFQKKVTSPRGFSAFILEIKSITRLTALLGVTSQLLLGCAHMRPRPVLGWRRAWMWGAVSCSGDRHSVTILTLQVAFL